MRTWDGNKIVSEFILRDRNLHTCMEWLSLDVFCFKNRINPKESRIHTVQLVNQIAFWRNTRLCYCSTVKMLCLSPPLIEQQGSIERIKPHDGFCQSTYGIWPLKTITFCMREVCHSWAGGLFCFLAFLVFIPKRRIAKPDTADSNRTNRK